MNYIAYDQRVSMNVQMVHIFIWYILDWLRPKSKKEIVYRKNEEIHKQVVAVDVKKIIPGFYYTSWDTKSSVYRIETRKKYYLVIPYC